MVALHRKGGPFREKAENQHVHKGAADNNQQQGGNHSRSHSAQLFHERAASFRSTHRAQTPSTRVNTKNSSTEATLRRW